MMGEYFLVKLEAGNVSTEEIGLSKSPHPFVLIAYVIGLSGSR